MNKPPGAGYTPHSAPITNGILRNSKFPRNEERRVTFSMSSRSQTQMNLDAIRAAMGEVKVDDPSAGSEKSRPPKEDSRKQKNDGERDKNKNKNQHCDRNKTTAPQTQEQDKRGIRDLTKEHSENGESNGTLDTVDTSDVNMAEERTRPRRRLSLLLDAKIETKMRRSNSQEEASVSSIEEAEDSLPVVHKPFSKKVETKQQNGVLSAVKSDSENQKKLESNSSGRPRSRLSLLVEKKIEAKTRRNYQEDESQGSIESDALPVVHKVKWNNISDDAK